MIKFGTSGFRGVFADNFTKENVQKIAFGLIKVFPKKFEIPIGYDNRFMGDFFAKWMAEVFVAYGYTVKFYKNSVPSTLIAFETKNKDFGVHITASHNPYFYNGVKIFMRGGRETTSDINSKIEKIANKAKNIKAINFDEAIKTKKIIQTENINNYCLSILKGINEKNVNKNLKVLFNNMNGSSLNCAKIILDKLGVKYKIFRDNIDPYFLNRVPAPYTTNLDDQIKILKKEKFDIGIAVDGDGDRISFIDKDGTPYDCNYVSAICYYYFLEYKKKKGDVVKNCALTEIITKLAKYYNQNTFDAKTGFKNIADIMAQNKKVILGIESNGMALNGHILHKDGLFCTALIIEILSVTNKTIKELINEIKKKLEYKCFEEEFSYPITDEQKSQINKLVFVEKQLPTLTEKIVSVDYTDGAKLWFENDHWAVVRFSGNENVVRIFAEMETKAKTEEIISALEGFIGVKERQI